MWLDDDNAQSVVEFALIVPLLLLVLFSVITLGYWMNAQQVVTQAAREGARTGALTNDNGQIEAAILSTLSGLERDQSRISMSVVPFNAADRPRGTPLTVRVEYRLPVVYEELPEAFKTVSSQSVTSMEYVP